MSRILLAIADRKIRGVLTGILVHAGHKVIPTDSEDEVFDILHKENPDLALIDVFFGENLVGNIKKNHHRMPLLCWMSDENARIAINFLNAGAFDCICPPLKASEILITINYALERFGVKVGGEKWFSLYVFFQKHKKKFYTTASTALFLLFMLSIISRKPYTRNDLPYGEPTSVFWDGKNLWVSSWYTQSIYRYQDEGKELKLKESCYFADFGAVAVTREGDYVWTAGNDYYLRQHSLNSSLKVQRKMLAGDFTPSGLAISGSSVWICDSIKKKIARFLVGKNMTLVEAYDCTLSAPVGLSWDGSHLWLADSSGNKLYLYRESSGELSLNRVYILPEFKQASLAGISPAGKWVYLLYSGSPAFILKYRIKSLKEYI